MKHIFAGAAAALFAMSTMASAASFTLDLNGLDGAPGGGDDAIFTSIPGGLEGDQPETPSNAVLEALGAQVPGAFQDAGNFDFWTVNGYQGAQVLFSGGKVRVELFGWEAGYENSFTLDGTTIGKGLNGLPSTSTVTTNDINAPLDAFDTGVLTGGVLPFSFTSENNGNPEGGVTNGTNPIVGQNFFVSCEGNASATSCNRLWVFYDDGIVFGDNHDDLVIRISAVPLPAGALLLVTGLGALALRRRKSV